MTISDFFLICEYFAKLQARVWLSRALCAPGQHNAKRRRDEESARDNHVLACSLPNIYRFKKIH